MGCRVGWSPKKEQDLTHPRYTLWKLVISQIKQVQKQDGADKNWVTSIDHMHSGSQLPHDTVPQGIGPPGTMALPYT